MTSFLFLYAIRWSETTVNSLGSNQSTVISVISVPWYPVKVWNKVILFIFILLNAATFTRKVRIRPSTFSSDVFFKFSNIIKDKKGKETQIGRIRHGPLHLFISRYSIFIIRHEHWTWQFSLVLIDLEKSLSDFQFSISFFISVQNFSNLYIWSLNFSN